MFVLTTANSGRQHHSEKVLDSVETMFSSKSMETRIDQWEHHLTQESPKMVTIKCQTWTESTEGTTPNGPAQTLPW